MSNIVEINGKYYDFGTKNESFLITAQELRSLGIKNWYFMLEVKYPNLGVQDLDPYDPNLTPEQIGRIIIECKNNVWFFIREVGRIPARGAPQPYKLCLTRASAATTWCFIHSINFILCQPRQTWKTTICILLLTYAFIFDYKNVEIPFMHIKNERCTKNAEMFRDYVMQLPKYLNPWTKLQKPPGTKSLEYAEHKTKITVTSSADNADTAMNMLRGITMYMMLADEWEFIQFIAQILAGAAPAMNSARDIARETNIRCCIMYLSTPGDLDTTTGRAAQKIIDNTPRFSEKMYDFTDDDIKAFFSGKFVDADGNPILDDGTGVGMTEGNPVTTLYIEFNYKQLRKTDEWLRAQYTEAAAKNEISEYLRGVLLKRFRGTGAELFKQEDVDYIRDHYKEPSHEIMILKKYVLYVYDHLIGMVDMNSETPYFDINLPYLIGIDIAAGGNGDNTAICIVHPYTLEIAAELETPYMGIFDLMRVITQVALLCPKGVFCVETNNIGKTIVDFVQETKLEHRFYHDPKLDISKNAIEYKPDVVSMIQRANDKGYIGTYVSPTVRNNMFDLLKAYVHDYRHLLTGKFLAQEIQSLVKMKNGKIAADSGAHDDMVMAYLHTIYVLVYGYKLERFGINKELITYDKSKNAIKAYEIKSEENVVNNMIPTEGGMNSYENIVLRSIQTEVNDAVNGFADGIDPYGYTRKQYNDTPENREAVEQASVSDLSFFYEVNTF